MIKATNWRITIRKRVTVDYGKPATIAYVVTSGGRIVGSRRTRVQALAYARRHWGVIVQITGRDPDGVQISDGPTMTREANPLRLI